MGQNYYNVLNLPIDANQDEIRNAYFEAAKKYHPDANPGDDAQTRFIEIQQAYDNLINIDRRKAYDKSLSEEDVKSPPVKLEILYSEPAVQPLDEEQLIYALVELNGEVVIEDSNLAPLHICLIVDRSNSMRGKRLEMVIANVRHLLRKLDQQDIISIVAFSDRSEIVIPPTNVKDIRAIESALIMMSAGGGTEIFQGLKTGFNLMRKSHAAQTFKQLILITDGHTYGDEQACLQLAAEARNENISINALGIGDEWNDIFLDRLAALSGGNAIYVRDTENLYNFIEEKIRSLNRICSRNLLLHYSLGEGIELTYAFRLHPDTTPLDSISPLPLGNLEYGRKTSVILEFTIKNIKQKGTLLQIAEGNILMDIPAREVRKTRIPLSIEREWSKNPLKENPPKLIMQALAKLSLYRLHEKARNDVVNGDIKKATMRLQSLASHLLAQGNRDIAEAVLIEVDHIQRTHQFSSEGDKKIKYGTRSLLMLPAPRQVKK